MGKYKGYVYILYDETDFPAAMFESTEEMLRFFPGRSLSSLSSSVSRILNGKRDFIRDGNKFYKIEKVDIEDEDDD